MKTPATTHPLAFRWIRHALAWLGLAVLGWQAANAQLPFPIYEPFPASYTNGTADETIAVPAGGASYPCRRLGNLTTATVWSFGTATGGGGLAVVGGAAGLSYPGLYQDPNPSVGLFIRTNNTTASRSRGVSFPTVSSGTVYASFLLNVQQAPSPSDPTGPNRLFVKFDNTSTTGVKDGSSTAMAGVFLTANSTLAISKSSSTTPGADTGTPLSAGTHLVVLRYTFNAGTDDDEVALWVDPASLGVVESSVPAPTITLTTGTDVASLSSLYIYHPNTEVVASMFLDEFRIAGTWADVTPTTAPCTPASISTQPTNTIVNEGIAASFSLVAGGTTPTYQWQVSTDGGSTWSDVSDGIGGATPTYQTRPLTPADSGTKYRAIVNVACGTGSAVTSSVVSVTVNPAVVTPDGVVVDDVFQDYWYNNLPYGPSNTVWFASTASTLDATSGSAMVGTAQTGTSTLWLGYFTDDSVTNLPVHLAVGHALKATLVFRASDITTNNGSLRIGVFDYADGGTRVLNDGFGSGSSGNAQNVRGYMVSLNFGANFSGNPFSLYARNNLGAGDLMGTTGNYLSLGGGPGGYSGAPAFQSGVDYTLDLTLARRALTSVQVTATVTGGGTNWMHTRTDTTYAYPRFDCLGFRAGNAENTATSYSLSRLLAQVISVAPDPIALNATVGSGNITLTWSNPVFALQAAPTVNGTYTNVPSATSPYTPPTGGTQMFYRLAWSAQ